jgi:ATPases involved in chromosome partitioning
MPYTVALVNPKGGSGKTTMAIHLAAAAHRDGSQTTLLDTDPQGSALDWSRRAPDGYDSPQVERLGDGRTLAAAIGQTGAEVVVIDSPARLDNHTGRILSNADLALVPVRPSGLDLWGAAEFSGVLEDHMGQGLEAAFAASQKDVRSVLSDELDAAVSQLDLPLLSGLSLRVSYARSVGNGETVLDGYDSDAAAEVRKLHTEVRKLA